MMGPNRVGFFAELRHGDPDGPSLYAALLSEPQPDEESLAAYLDAGAVLAATGRLVDDVLDPGRLGVAPLETRTDGEWVWPGDLSYYVRTHHVELPSDLTERARSLGYVPPEIDDVRLTQIARVVRAR